MLRLTDCLSCLTIFITSRPFGAHRFNSSKMHMIKAILIISFIATASARCGTTCGGCTAPCVNAPSDSCYNCGYTPCEGSDGSCWSCSGSNGYCYAYDCALCAIHLPPRPSSFHPHPCPFLRHNTTQISSHRLMRPVRAMSRCLAGGSYCSTQPCSDVTATAHGVPKLTNSTLGGFAKAKGEQLATPTGSVLSKAAAEEQLATRIAQ